LEANSYELGQLLETHRSGVAAMLDIDRQIRALTGGDEVEVEVDDVEDDDGSEIEDIL
jgi:hypothetical protein